MDIVELVRTRYTTKHYDPARRISDRDIADLMEVLRLSPSSVNSQPWHFFVTGTDEGKARVMPAVLDFNRPRVADASHLVVFAVPVEFTEERFRRLVAQELADGRVTTEDAASGAADAGRRHFVGLHQVTQEELLSWETRQAYIAMGFLLDLPRGPRHGEDGRMPRTRRKGPAHRLCREPRLPPARRQQRRPSEVPPAHGRGRDRLLTHGSPLGAPAPDPIRSFGPHFLPENAGRAVLGGNAGAGPVCAPAFGRLSPLPDGCGPRPARAVRFNQQSRLHEGFSR